MNNTLKTSLFLGSLFVIFITFGGLLAGFKGLTIAFIMALFSNAIAYFFSDKIVLRMYKAQPLDSKQYKHVYTLVESLISCMALPMPKLWLVDSVTPNAFATGRSTTHASIALTSSLLHLLDEAELRGVLAHEMSHIKNKDMLISTLAATLAAALGYIAVMARNHMMYQALGSKKQKGNWFAVLIVSLLMPVIATILQLAGSRSREFLADASAARYTHEPLALASALQKIHKGVERQPFNADNKAKAATASLFIVHPFSPTQKLASLFCTHPSLQARLQKLYNMIHPTYTH